MAIASEDLPGPLTFTNFVPAKARPLHHVDAAPNPTLIPLNLARLRRGLARILEKQNRLQMSEVFSVSCIDDQMGVAFQGFYERDRGTGKITGFPHQL